MMVRPKKTRRCVVQTCNAFLANDWPGPTCPVCDGVQRADKPIRPGTRIAEVVFNGGYTPVLNRHPVTLPAEPWIGGA